MPFLRTCKNDSGRPDRAGDYTVMYNLTYLLAAGLAPIRYLPEVIFCKTIKDLCRCNFTKLVPLHTKPGMVTGCVTDLDNDKQEDLVVTGEWMPIRLKIITER